MIALAARVEKVGSIDETIEIWLAENALPMCREQMHTNLTFGRKGELVVQKQHIARSDTPKSARSGFDHLRLRTPLLVFKGRISTLIPMS